MANIKKQIRQAELEAIQIEMDIMWHEQAKRYRGFSDYDALMNGEELTIAKERRKGLRAFITESRKKLRANAN
jgi:hypothetical protein